MTDGGTPRSNPSWMRRIAFAVVRAAAQMLPASQQRWAMAMVNETAHLRADGEALRWALGCLYAAGAVRIRSLYLLDVALIRIAATVLATLRMVDVALPTALTLAYTTRESLASALGQLTPGDDYRRLVPLIEALPMWLHAMLAAAALCYALAGVSTLRRRSTAAGLWLLGVVLEQGASFAARPVLAQVGIVVVPHPSIAAALVLPVIMPLLFATVALSGPPRPVVNDSLG